MPLFPSGIASNTLLSIMAQNPDGGKATVLNAFKAIEPMLSHENTATKPLVMLAVP
jgi:hypothetical protein